MMTSDYIMVRQAENVAYALPGYDAVGDEAKVLSSSLSACHGSLVADTVKGMRRKRIFQHKEINEKGEEISITDSIVYGVN